ncbi:hypothetical protein BJ138DRAFT_756699 [Hygrophoropsis aurantiaca]|uniref:Uncharacterized protein n=1 Tax=Hygrophoropsis aurantiaca TaxID=72124 RepID=A0ACB8AH02_9AGAM|nr:hypothetical protein BJ138DRAFT_756699 [Hygrophoropsis aurantiaca]
MNISSGAGPSRPISRVRLDSLLFDHEDDLHGLIAQLTLEDIEAMENALGIKTLTGAALNDRDVAMGLLLQNARELALLNNDRALAQSLANVVDDDPPSQPRPDAVNRVPDANQPDTSETSQSWGSWFFSWISPTTAPQSTSGEREAEPSISPAARRQSRVATGHNCTVCLDAIYGAEVRAPCGHFYGIDCITDLFQSATRDETLYPPRCCRQPIDFAQVKRHLSPALVRLFKEKGTEFGTLKRVYCASPTCSRFLGPLHEGYFSKIYTCPVPTCATKTCGKCRAKHDRGESCTDNSPGDVLALGRRAGWARCPGCAQMIELNVGCYHMTCRCRTEFCYLCTKTWKTCRCPQWDERRLMLAAEQRVEANFGPRHRAQAALHQRQAAPQANPVPQERQPVPQANVPAPVRQQRPPVVPPHPVVPRPQAFNRVVAPVPPGAASVAVQPRPLVHAATNAVRVAATAASPAVSRQTPPVPEWLLQTARTSLSATARASSSAARTITTPAARDPPLAAQTNSRPLARTPLPVQAPVKTEPPPRAPAPSDNSAINPAPAREDRAMATLEHEQARVGSVRKEVGTWDQFFQRMASETRDESGVRLPEPSPRESGPSSNPPAKPAPARGIRSTANLEHEQPRVSSVGKEVKTWDQFFQRVTSETVDEPRARQPGSSSRVPAPPDNPPTKPAPAQEDRSIANLEHGQPKVGSVRRAAESWDHFFQRMVDETMDELRVNHDCEHTWRYRAGSGGCENCHIHLPKYLFGCSQCEMKVCNRCRRNRL